MIQITPEIFISENEIEQAFIRSSGPGGQNVNKVATTVQLRFDAGGSPNLPPDVRERLLTLAGKRVTTGGVLVIQAGRFRTQEQNRQDALQRLVLLIQQAARKPKTRRPTKPGKKAREQRLATKKHKSRLKKMRGPVKSMD